MSILIKHGKQELELFNVEDTFLGASITERDGLNIWRVCTEVHNTDDLKSMRDFLTELIDRINK